MPIEPGSFTRDGGDVVSQRGLEQPLGQEPVLQDPPAQDPPAPEPKDPPPAPKDKDPSEHPEREELPLADPPEHPAKQEPPAATPPEGGGEPEGFKAPETYTVKGQEIEYPDWAKGLMKDEESTKEVKEIFEKYSGFDHVKNDRDMLQHQNEEYNTHYAQQVEPIINQVNIANECLRNNDFGSFIKACNVPPQMVLQWSLNYAQQNPQQRQAAEQHAQDVVSQYYQSSQTQNQYSDLQNQLIQAREREVDLLLSRPEIAHASQQIDQRFGRIGVLKDEIIRRGQQYAAQKQDIPAEQLLGEVLNLAGVVPGQAAAPVGGQPTPQQRTGGQPATRTRVQKPTIRNIGSGGRSPVRSSIKSREDLLKRAAELEAQGR